MELSNWFNKGITLEQYIKSLDDHKDRFMNIYQHFSLPDDDAFYHNLKSKNLRVLVLAEPWCGHCMLNIPILARLTEKADMPMSILPRDTHVELMDQYLTNGKRVIPIFIFIDKNGNEVTKWGPIAKTTKAFIEQHTKTMPDKDDSDYDQAFKKMIAVVSETFSTNEDLWNGSYYSLKEALYF